MKRPIAALSLIAIAWLALPLLRGERPDPGDLPPSGAMQALDFWAASRAYPNEVIPEIGIAVAWDETRRAAARQRAGGIDGGTAPWATLGPANIGGRTLALALLPGNPDVIFAGSASGGLWKSTTGGVGATAWTRITTGFPVTSVGTIEIDPANPSDMYIGTGEVYGYQSSTGGEVVRTTRGSYGIGILKSTDGGATWTMSLDWTSAQTRGVWAIRIDPSNSDRVFAATTEGVYRSTDAGGSWSQVLDRILATDLRIHPASPDTVLAACGNFGSAGGGLYRSLDGGDSWAELTTGLPGSWSGKAQIDIAPSSPDVVYASLADTFSGHGLYKSTNAGTTWSFVNGTDYPQYQGWYSHYVRVSPFDADRLYVGGIEIWRSTNGGTTLQQRSQWTAVYFGTPPAEGPYGGPSYAHADHHFAVPHPTDPDVFFFASDGGVFKTTNGGDSFVGLNGGYTTTQFYNGFSNSASDPQLAMGGMQDNFTAIWTGSPAWRRVIGGDGTWTAIHPTDPDVMYGGYQYLGTLVSFDGGDSWDEITPPRPGGEATAFVAPYVMCPDDPGYLYAGRTRVYSSAGTGYSWVATNGGQPLDGTNPALSMAVSPTSKDTVYVGTAPISSGVARIFRTTNGGDSWDDVTGPLPDRYPMDLAVDPGDARTVYVALSGFGASHVWRSTNGGTAWTDIGAGLPDVPASAVAVDPDHPEMIYVGNDLGVWVSPNAGGAWQPFSSGMPPALVNDLKVYAPGRLLRAATHGNGAWERPLADPPAVGVDQVAAGGTAPLEEVRLAVAPNPIRTDSRVRFELREAARVRIALHDVAGRRVRDLVDEDRPAGAHSIALEPHGLAAGVYFVRMEAGRDVEMTRVVYLR